MSNPTHPIHYASPNQTVHGAIDCSEDMASNISSSMDVKASKATVVTAGASVAHLNTLPRDVTLRQSPRVR